LEYPFELVTQASVRSEENFLVKATPYRRIVIKLGTNLLTTNEGQLDSEVMASLAEQVASLHRKEFELALVSSGAIAAGRHKLGLPEERKGIPFKQVLASVGQNYLMHAYEQLFSQHHIIVAQALLTRIDMSSRAGYLNARNTLLALLELGVIPIINENDVVATDELGDEQFGDNDNLSAMVANLIDADLLMLLGNVAGLYSTDPNFDPNAHIVRRVENIDAEIIHLAKGASGPGTGGMITKIEAAELATSSGAAVVIADGHERGVITRLVAGEELGTFFVPATSRMESRKRWMLSGISSKGKVVIDDGAVTALTEQNGSLLAAGIEGVEGEFKRGDVVDIIDATGNRIARGISNYNSRDITTIKSSRSSQISALLGYEYGAEVVHRNNLVLL
jgi:glutamate 5-kinase